MYPNSPAYPTPVNGDHRSRTNIDSAMNYNSPKFDGSRTPRFGSKADSSFNACSNRSSNGYRQNDNRNRFFNQNLAQPRGYFYSDTRSDAYKNKKSKKAPQRFGAGRSANHTFHGESRRDGNLSLNEYSYSKQQGFVSSNNCRGGSFENRNDNYESANKSFHQMNFRGRTQSDPSNRQYQGFSQSDNQGHIRGHRSSSQSSFVDRRHFVNDRNINSPRQTMYDWKMPHHQDNYGQAHESQMFIYNSPARCDFDGRSSSTNGMNYHSRDKENLYDFRGVQTSTPIRQNNLFHGVESSIYTSQNTSSHNQEGPSDSGHDANTAFHEDDDDEVFETTGPLDTTDHLHTSLLSNEDIQHVLNSSFKNEEALSKRISSIFCNNGIDKKKLFHKTTCSLSQSFAGFERDGPSPISEGKEETEN